MAITKKPNIMIGKDMANAKIRELIDEANERKRSGFYSKVELHERIGAESDSVVVMNEEAFFRKIDIWYWCPSYKCDRRQFCIDVLSETINQGILSRSKANETYIFCKKGRFGTKKVELCIRKLVKMGLVGVPKILKKHNTEVGTFGSAKPTFIKKEKG